MKELHQIKERRETRDEKSSRDFLVLRQMAKDNVSLERQGQNPEDIIRIARDRDLINEVSQKALEKEDIVRGIAPIDHYLTFPLRGNYSQFKDIPPTSTVKSIQRSCTVSKDDEGQTIKGESIKAESTRGHYVAASRVLSEIQERRNRLECNLDTLVRQRDQNRLYEYIDQHGSNQSDDIQRIRQEVDKKIEEISAQLQRETIAPVKEIPKMPEKVENQKKLSVKPNTRYPARGGRQKIDNKSDTGKKSTKSKKKLEGKEKSKKKGIAQKPESALGSQLQDAITPTSYDPGLLAAIFGQRVHDHHRSTVRPPHIQFHSPSKVSSAPSRPQYTQEPQDVRRTTSPIYETKDDRGAKGAKQTKYYFQPSDPHYGDEAARINYPSSGELVPVAQPLGKPRQDSKFRLAIPSTERPQTRHVGKTNGNIDTQSNIAVIEIKADEPRTPDWKKKAERLAIQNLPSLDIQAPPKQEENDRESDSGNKRISLTPPKQEDYDGFQNYIACDDVIAPNEHESGSEAELGLEFRGQDFGKPREYNEPRFPPERPPCEMESKPATAEIQCKTSLEERAQEWVEQELLARIVNEMNVPQDPTIFRPHDGSIQSQSSSESSDEEEHDWIHEILGPSGMQLFVDAGISMNDQLLAELIREVVAEKIASLMGHPKKMRTPKREIIPEEPRSEAASHVSTPLQTPVYTPIQSEASSVHTPALSSFTEESSQEEELNPDKQKEDTIIEDEMPNKLIDAVKVSTPPQTPTITSSPVPFSQHVDTPLSSTREEAKSEIMSRALTPEASEMTGSVRTLDEFQGTELEYSETPDEEAPPQSPMISPRAAPSPLQPVIHVIPGPASPQHSSFTISSSTAVGTSLFEGISEGEKLCPDSIIPGLYSEGEFPVSEGQAILSALEDLEDEVQNNFKQLLQNLAGRKENLQNGVSDANGTATMKDTEDIEEDTLGEVSISEGEFLERDNAVMKLLTQIKSPPNIQSAVNDNAGINRDKSEGEVSIGEEQVDSRKRNQAGYRDWRKKKNEGIQRRILSVGEVPSSSNNGSRLPSYSIGEVRDLSATDVAQHSKKQSSEESVRPRRPTLDNRTATRRKEVSENSLPRYSGIDVRPRNSTQGSEVNVGQGELLESLSSPEKDDTEGDPLEKPRTILVQSGNFGTASSFNFTDSLNEQKFGTLNEQDLKDMISDNSVDAGAVGRDSGPDSGADDVFDNRQITGAEKPPTKITLMIPSVADEDSEDDMTIDGDDGYSNEDVSNISL